MHRAAACLFTGVVSVACALAQAPDPASPVDAVRAGRGRGAPRKGPPGPLPRLSDGHPDLTGIWNGFGGSGQPGPNMLAWAQKVVEERRARNGAEDYEARCLPGGPPRAAPYHTALFATPKLVLMLFEGNTHMYRQFFVDGSDHPRDLKPTFYGDSRAHWDGDTLVVDTVSFFEKSWFDFPGTPHTKDMHLIERFHRTDYGNMEMDVTIEDSGVFTKPWTFHRTTTLEPNFEMTEYVCNENNQDPAHLDAAYKLDAGARKRMAEGVDPPPARKPPAPPSGANPRREDGKVDFSGVWVPASTQLPSDPAYILAYQKVYEERKANKGKDDPERFCLPDGAVRVTPQPYKIVQRSDQIALLWEANTHSYRRFFLDGRQHNLEIEPESWTGQSIGKWDGDTLVVDTIGFNDKTWLDSTGKPHSGDMHLTERYRRPDLGHLNVAITIEDPKALTKPYQFTRTFTLAPGLELQEYVCQAVLDGVYE
ncbi:MAG TPA: hypothetical protein VN203_06690 [Candidatus Acidoferrum sp.]|nr:hypothetical protein [Candidatus Acidoferrum sp.]